MSDITEQPSTDKAISDRLHTIFPDAQTAERVVQIVATKRPIGWGRKSSAPYYTSKNAIWLKKYVDNMLISGQTIIFRYEVFCGAREEKMTKKTLYNVVHQSLLYLLENLDPDKTYAKWYESVFKEQKRGVGVSIRFKPGYGPDQSEHLPAPEMVLPRENMPKWKAKLEEYLEGEDKEPFIQEKLALSPDEIRELKEQFVGVEGVAVSITSNAVKVIRMI